MDPKAVAKGLNENGYAILRGMFSKEEIERPEQDRQKPSPEDHLSLVLDENRRSGWAKYQKKVHEPQQCPAAK